LTPGAQPTFLPIHHERGGRGDDVGMTNGASKLPVGISPRRAGVTVSGIAAPCPQTWRRREPLLPPGPEPAFAIALSGGGFRATLSGLGVLRFFAAAGLLGDVRVVSS